MDTQQSPDRIQAKVAADIERIRTQMPGVYASIKAKADEIGNVAYALVKQGCAGKPNTFYAFEAGHIVGTAFAQPDITRDVAHLMVQFGIRHACIWPTTVVQGDGNGAN